MASIVHECYDLELGVKGVVWRNMRLRIIVERRVCLLGSM